MPINRDLSDLPAPPPRGSNAPLREGTLIAHELADRWWNEYQAGPDFTRESAMPELPLRASMMGMRCDRQLWYVLTGTPQSNPPGAASVWRMRMGTLIHREVENTMAPNEFDETGKRHGWWAEDVVDLRPAGYPGSAHGDMILYDHGVSIAVGETKSIGGFAYKMCATNFKGVPEGPRWEHVLQAAIVAVATDTPLIVTLYISPESVSPDLAKSSGLDEYGKFISEWQFPTADWMETVAFEVARQQHVLDLATPNEDGIAWMPTRQLHHPDIPSGSIVDNPANGHHVQIDAVTGKVKHSGKAWYCGYCSFRDQCLSDGEEMVPVTIGKKSA